MPNTTKIGSKVYISQEAVNSDILLAGYEALTWVEVGGVVSYPPMGVASNMVSRDLIDSDVTDKVKGYASAGDGDLEVAPDHDNSGQIELLEAGASDYRFKRGIKIESNDKLNGTGTNTIRYSRALISGPRVNGGAGEDFDTETYTFAFVQPPIIDKATAGA